MHAGSRYELRQVLKLHSSSASNTLERLSLFAGEAVELVDLQLLLECVGA